MTSRPLLVLGAFIILAAVAAAAGYAVNGRRAAMPGSALPEAATAASTVAATTTDPAASGPTPGPVSASAAGSMDVPLPASSTADISAWVPYASDTLGYSLKRPADLILSGGDASLVMSMPGSAYFHWPLLDTASVSLTVASSCPAVPDGAAAGLAASFDLGGHRFSRSVSLSAAAGSRQTEIAYDALSGGRCYRLALVDRGPASASLYVDDASLIRRYDDQHRSDQARALSVLNGVASSLILP